MKSSTQMSGKKPYQGPKLTVYGTIRELTQANNNPGAVTDAVSGKMLKSK